jgi:dTDP-4-amino-4,6-dideoxygalactose transaminase
MPYWKDRYQLKPEDFPEAERRFQRTVSLPLYPTLRFEAVDRVCNQIRTQLEGP